MSLVQEILYTVSNYPGGYKILYNLIYKSRSPGESEKLDRTVRTTLSRMKKQGLVSNDGGEWSITPEGQEFLGGRNSDIRKFFPAKTKKNKSVEKNLIIIFDIPEKKRRYRDWLRMELVMFGFEQIQKSVWFGPSISKEFLEYLEEEGLVKYLKFFKASQKDLI